jgi:hypothetical protein
MENIEQMGGTERFTGEGEESEYGMKLPPRPRMNAIKMDQRFMAEL